MSNNMKQINEFEKFFNKYYSNASFVRWYTKYLVMIREQYQRKVVESFLFINKNNKPLEKRLYDFQIAYHFEYLPNKQGKIVKQYHSFELKLDKFEGEFFDFDKPVRRLDTFRKKALKLIYTLTNNQTIKKFI